jgi:hypothetical protein
MLGSPVVGSWKLEHLVRAVRTDLASSPGLGRNKTFSRRRSVFYCPLPLKSGLASRHFHLYRFYLMIRPLGQFSNQLPLLLFTGVAF